MRMLSIVLTVLASISSVIGGISRLTVHPIITDSRVYAGVAVILLLLAIALNTLEKKT